MNVFIEVPASKASLAQRNLIHGVGVNDADYIVRAKVNGKNLFCPYYLTWKNMLRRCYCRKYQEKQPTYKGCSVTKEWLALSVFRSWMETQDWEGKQLDKDLLIPKNKVYGPYECMFVSRSINILFTDSAAARGDLPQGVCFNKPAGKYQANCRVNGKLKYLGLFIKASVAEKAYLSFKSALVKKVAFEEEAASNPKLQAALLIHADLFKQKAEDIK
ncbi:MAG: hypothetical protein JKY81_00195 [Colwellia sp.]|nr:hypothetical protein [Colwellia sp.]